ncbi:MAG TPA: hypothetical protein VGM91_02345 [Conexibacter sp.]|jgi:hypothetical protein
MTVDLLGSRPRVERDVGRRIRDWTREAGGFSAAASVSVQELRCAEPGCPDVETVVLIGLGPRRTVQHKICKPASDVTREDVVAALERQETTR